jgi:hypothetical protein|tara:strand:- start:266 stop:511 length:246 start_codon:yes stop_codon:yes gene_type:complete
MSDNRGYSNKIAVANRKADVSSSGVKLGRFCIENDKSVLDMAVKFNVSRITIYKWFDGSWLPNKAHERKILRFLERENGRA